MSVFVESIFFLLKNFLSYEEFSLFVWFLFLRQSPPSLFFVCLFRSMETVRPLELIAPGPRLSKVTEATLMRYCQSAVDAMGDKRVVRTERLPPEDFCFDAAQVG